MQLLTQQSSNPDHNLGPQTDRQTTSIT